MTLGRFSFYHLHFGGGQLGPGGSNGGRGHRKILSVMFKYAVFDIKPTYDRYFFVISDAQVHCVCQCSIKNYCTVLYSTKILLGGQSCGSLAVAPMIPLYNRPCCDWWTPITSTVRWHSPAVCHCKTVLRSPLIHFADGLFFDRRRKYFLSDRLQSRAFRRHPA